MTKSMSSNRAFLVAAAVIAAVLVLGVTAGIVLLGRDSPAVATGDLIAYGCKEKNNHWYAICVIRSDGTEVERLTSKLETTDPAWSRDGRRIAFTRNQDVGESTKFTSDDVFVMESDGDDARRLTPERVGRSSGQPAWSPDGEQIVYVDGPKVFSGVPSRFGSLFVVDSDGGEARRLTRGSADTDPDWSPNGNEIVFTRGVTLSSPTDANEDIYVLDVATGATHQLTTTPAGVYETAPAWSPDGSLIAFARGTNSTEFDGKSSIYVMNRDGSGERLLLANTLFAESPYSLSWSPDGSLLAFETSSMLGCTSISILDVASGTSRPLTSCTRPIETTVAPSWQPAAA